MNREMTFIHNKKSIMCLAALQILIFHLWVMISSDCMGELFIRKTAYTGVDIFFFLSAYSLTVRGMDDLKAYYISRFKSVYLKFVVFVMIAALLNDFGLVRTLQILLGFEMLVKGGGAFLGFIPAIMLFYLVFPLVHRLIRPRPGVGAALVIAVYFAGGIAATRYLNIPSLYIFWNRIPILVCGFLAAVYREWLGNFFHGNKGLCRRLAIGAGLLFIGVLLVYRFGFTVKLGTPISEIYYVMGIPMVLGMILLADLVPAVKPVRLLGDSTLEMYSVQMIWGFGFANCIFSMSHSPLLTDLLTVAFVSVAGISISRLFNCIFEWLARKRRG